jgi:phospholipase C
MLARAHTSLAIAAVLPLAALVVAGSVVTSACSHTAATPNDDAGSSSTGVDDGDAAATGDGLAPPPAPARTATETDLAPKRAACTFAKGAWAQDTIGVDYPIGKDIPINHVIVIMQENRSFDHYLGRLVAQSYYKPGDFSEGDGGKGSGFSHSDQLDGPPAGWSNPDSDGGPVYPHPDNENCYGVSHGWEPMHDDYDNGRLDHFVTQNNPDGQRVMFYEDDTVIPFYYALASTFSVGDRYFASVPSSTWPNRYFLMAATSYGIGDNSFDTNDTAATPAIHLFTLLDAAGRTWKDYTDGPHQLEFYPSFGFAAATRAHYADVKCGLMTDIQNGTLPDVSLVMGDEVGQFSDEGPSALPGIGGQWVEGILRALFASPSWKDTAVFITYDENGGIADHVPPAPACKPDDIAPHIGDGGLLKGAFDMTGFRVPFIVVSPYSRAHFVSHTVYDHTSLTRFIEARFGLPALSGRDANAIPPFEMFDFKNPPFATPPDIQAHTVVPPDVMSRCGQAYSTLGCGN